MAGAEPILPSRFTPMGYEILPAGPKAPDAASGPPRLVPARLESPAIVPPVVGNAEASPAEPAAKASPPLAPLAVAWSLPLVDRTLTQTQKTAEIASELVEAISRIEPLYDPTRLEGADAPQVLKISAGTALMDSVFADRWRRASLDPNVDLKVTYLALAWRTQGVPCEAFSKNRAHDFGEPALTALSAQDCADVARAQEQRFVDGTPAPIVVAPISVPVFAAPLPGSRLSSKDFWAAQRARVAAIQAHLDRKWRPLEASSSAAAGAAR